MKEERDERRVLLQCLKKFPFLVTAEDCQKLKLDKEGQPKAESIVKEKEKIPIGVRMNQPQYDYDMFKPRCNQVKCCSRNLICTYPQNLPPASPMALPKVGKAPPPPTTTYQDTIGKTGLDIFKAMKLYHLQKTKKLAK